MVEFNLWREAFIFGAVYAVVIIVPCVLVAIWGKEMIERLGQFPTKTPSIQLSVLFKLVFTEIITFACLIFFFQFFAAGK